MQVREACQAHISTSARSGAGLQDISAAVVTAAGLPSIAPGKAYPLISVPDSCKI